MDDDDAFDAVFGSNPNLVYKEDKRRKIVEHRQKLEGKLFIDRLLEALGFKDVPKSYPPRSNQDLRNLHYQIISCSAPDHHKQAVLYYILRDVSPEGEAKDFVRRTYLPDKYKTFIDGIWHMDRLDFEDALFYLTDPILTPTFPEEILYTLCCHTLKDNVTLPVAYYHAVSPTFTSKKCLEAYFTTLCRINITEAFYFSRTQGDLNHRTLFEKLITFVHAESKEESKAARAVALISLPLNKDEEIWFRDCLTKGKRSGFSGAADTLRMRDLATGNLPNTQSSSTGEDLKIDGVSWKTLKATPG